MNKNVIFKSLLNGVAACLLFALLMSLTKGLGFVQVLAASKTIILGLCTIVGSFIGYIVKAIREEEL